MKDFIINVKMYFSQRENMVFKAGVAGLSLVCAVSCAIFFSAPPVSGAGAESRPLTRTEDYVLFTGADVSGLTGYELDDIQLYSFGDSGFKAVPFQIDKRDEDGRLVFPDEKLRDPLRDATKLDGNDEMVFMAKDSGARRTEGAWPDDAARGVEIELIDPLTSGRGWAYLFHRPGAEPPETQDYVSYRTDDAREYIKSGQYEVGQRLGKNFYDWLRLRKPDGRWGVDIYDRQKMMMKAMLLNGAIPINVPEQQVKSRIFGVIDGPVRVIRDEMNFVNVKVIGLEYMTEYFVTYYYNGNISPIEVTIPITAYKVFLEVSLYYGIDFNEAVLGSVFRNPANPKGIVLDGEPDTDIDDHTDNSYMIVTGDQGSLMEVIVFDDNLNQMLDRPTYVVEDLQKKDPNGDHPGILMAGFYTATAKKLRKGNYQYWIYHYYPYPFSEKRVQGILNMIEHPMEIEFHAMTRPADRR